MGYFSWKTADTNRSIPNVYAERDYGVKIFTVYMLAPDGRKWKEEAYEGYGEFGGKDIYTLVAELNGYSGNNEDKLRTIGIDITHGENNESGDFGIASRNGIKVPKLVEDGNLNYDNVGFSENCEYQGFFYPYENEEY